MNIKPRLPLDQLTSVEVDDLLKIVGEAQGFLRHDFVGTKGLVQFFFHKLKLFFNGQATEEDLRDLQEYFFIVQDRANELFRRIETHLIDKRVEWSLTSYLPDIADKVAVVLRESGLEEFVPQGPKVHVAFPQGALYSIALELARNAAVHAPGSPVALEWSVQSSKLCLSVHDGGVALISSLSERLRVLELPVLHKRGGGLSFVRRIVQYSKGEILVRRSATLGGAEFLVNLPISSHFEEAPK